MMELADIHTERGHFAAAQQEPRPRGPLFEPVFLQSAKAGAAQVFARILAFGRGERAVARDELAESAGCSIPPERDPLNTSSRSSLSPAPRPPSATGGGRVLRSNAITLAESLVEKDSPSYLIGFPGPPSASSARPWRSCGGATLSAALVHLEQTLGPITRRWRRVVSRERGALSRRRGRGPGQEHRHLATRRFAPDRTVAAGAAVEVHAAANRVGNQARSRRTESRARGFIGLSSRAEIGRTRCPP
jgi:hypothetical protein